MSIPIPGIWFPKIYQATLHQDRLSKIDILDFIDLKDFKKKYAANSVPFILRGSSCLIGKESATDVLLDKFGDQSIDVRFGDMSKPSNYLNRKVAQMTLTDFFTNHYLNPSADLAYAGSSIVNKDFIDVLNIKYPKFYPTDFFNSPRLWFGKGGTTTHLHKDIPDNFAICVFGVKKWIIYPPKDYPYLYMVNPNENEFPDFGASLIDIRAPDIVKFPEFPKANSISFTQLAGEMLYLPAGWSHHVENLDNSLMINFWLKREHSPAILGLDK